MAWTIKTWVTWFGVVCHVLCAKLTFHLCEVVVSAIDLFIMVVSGGLGSSQSRPRGFGGLRLRLGRDLGLGISDFRRALVLHMPQIQATISTLPAWQCRPIRLALFMPAGWKFRISYFFFIFPFFFTPRLGFQFSALVFRLGFGFRFWLAFSI